MLHILATSTISVLSTTMIRNIQKSAVRAWLLPISRSRDISHSARCFQVSREDEKARPELKINTTSENDLIHNSIDQNEVETIEKDLAESENQPQDSVEAYELDFSGELPNELVSENQSSAQLGDDISVPWYLRQEVTSNLLDGKDIKIPDIPADSPPHLSEFLDLLAKDLGIDELLIFDIKSLDDSHEFKLNRNDLDYIIIGTGKSERHIYKAASELRTHIKHQYGVIPSIQGMVSSAKTPAMRRRLLRRARKGPSATDNDYGFSANSWILCLHDGVEVHMLTERRRSELNLELIWCAPEDRKLYEKEEVIDYESDNVLHNFARRRGTRAYHTSTRSYSTHASNAGELDHLLESLNRLPQDASSDRILELKRDFEDLFQGADVKEFDIRTSFLKSIHLVRSDLVPFQEVEDSILQKHASKLALTYNSLEEKVNDVTKYAQLLLDTPEIIRNSKVSSDNSLDKLSRFISTLFEFSNEEFSLSADTRFLPLVWRLAYTDSDNLVHSKMVSDIIDGKKKLVPNNTGTYSTLASNKMRDILAIASHQDKIVENGELASQNEAILFTYGNCGKWEKFWQQWERTSFLGTCTPAEKLDSFVRLAVFLALKSNKSQSYKFLRDLWTETPGTTGGFMGALAQNSNKFDSETQRDAFLLAVNSMVTLIQPEDMTFFRAIRSNLAQMKKDVFIAS